MRRLPWITLAVAGAAVAVHALPTAGEWLVYDRARVDAGEWWRIASASLVHVSAAHLALDVAAFGVGGAVVERRGRAHFALLCLAAAVAVGVGVHLFAPGLARYAGLSGVAHAALAAWALDALGERGATRWVGAGLLAVVAAKLAIDLSRPAPLFFDAGADVVAAPASHLAGLLVAAILAIRWRRLALLCPVLATVACATPTEHLRVGAAAAPVVLRHARRAADDAAPPARPRRIGVAIASESAPRRWGGVIANMQGGMGLSFAARDTLARELAAILRRQPALRGSEIVVLPPGDEELARDRLAARHGIDALCMVGYEQMQRTSNSPFLLLELALLAPPFILPTLRGEATTLLDVVAVRLDDGRALFRAGATSRVHARAVPMFAGSHPRDLRLRGLHEAVAAVAADLPRALAGLADTTAAR